MGGVRDIVYLYCVRILCLCVSWFVSYSSLCEFILFIRGSVCPYMKGLVGKVVAVRKVKFWKELGTLCIYIVYKNYVCAFVGL